MTDVMRIGQLADAADTATTTLRYYDEIGLVTPTARVGGQRRYSVQAVRRLQVVHTCQQAGFTLDEIGQLLDGAGDWQALARRKREKLQQRIAELHDAVGLVDAALACGCEHLEGCDRIEHDVAAP